MRSSFTREPIRQLLQTIVDNRGMTVPAADGGIPLIATNCIKETSLYPTFENIRYVSEETHRTWFRAHLQPEDILFVNKGTPGRVCMVPDPVSFCAAQDMIGLRADRSKVYPRYLFAFLRSDWVKEKIRNYHVGLAIPHFKKQDLDAITVPKRSDDEQKAIGDLYFLLSEKIELNNRINAELEGMAKLLYDYWFVQFDFPMSAAQATALGKPHLTGHPYRASGGKMIYNETLKREIPEGWEASTLGELYELYQPKTITESELNPDGKYLVYGANGIVGRYDSFNHADSMVALTCRGSTCGTLTQTLPNSWITGNAMVMKPRADAMCIDFTINQARRAGIHSIITGSGQPQITRANLEGLKVIRPDLTVLTQYRDVCSPGRFQRLLLTTQNQELTQLRDWLLPMLMNGQVTVGTNER
jgi:type I restriction enzyme S subunit